MNKNKITVFFSIVFLTFIIAPTIISVIDSSVDISFIYSNSEEEPGTQKGEKEKVVLSPIKINEFLFSSIKRVNALSHINKNYTKPYLNMVFPPPKIV